MKKLSWFNKFMWLLNIVLTVLTVIAYVLPFLAPKMFPLLSVLTLFMPMFLILNAFFFVYWAVLLKKQVVLPALLLLAGITFINKFYKFSPTELPDSEKDFTVMSYNVRLFNLFDWIPNDDVGATIQDFINDQNPDIVCLQEYSERANVDLKVYPHKYIMMQGNQVKTGQAIYSKFPIIDQGKLELPNSNNNVVYADIRKGKDTIRIYSMHLQSIKITPDVDEINNDHLNKIDEKKRKAIFRRASEAFKRQQQQAEIIRDHRRLCKFPVIICGDMNNSAFSYVYRVIKGKLGDAFEDAGKGFGQTYKFKYYPARIDYIFADPKLQVKSFVNFTEFENSDHYPIMTRLEVRE
ncbi:endonuclease/exonuclease/phosphatase family protein [Flavobacterium selenitireducens]|uniref:endonuclease/exonuclease/phosphatase family protein n=1 Tax=Flavobacterium selenitireducens TaxID=2722704 RepID=UPI00168B2127|nr:endonuclease/exonuclease/phosphatase family protein [Flavobacterium selenitireducens]MBD3582475.1 endonuclease/exonuclease/phosphatase family protein [Flavobacterium selenitireducens]